MSHDKQKITSFLEKLNSPRFPATYTGEGLEESLKVLRSSERKNHKDVGQMVLLLTDGIASDKAAADKWVSHHNFW